MKRTTMKRTAAVVFAAGLALGVGGNASAQVAGQYCSPNGASTTIVQNGYRYYYSCRSNRWVFVKACPVGGGMCFE